MRRRLAVPAFPLHRSGPGLRLAGRVTANPEAARQGISSAARGPAGVDQ
ncbi:hypothetical protein [Longispora albida]|nr:hypothetical protein [Longispora albida]